MALTPNHNGVEIIFCVGRGYLANTSHMDGSDNIPFQGRLWGYAANGPAEKICDVSCTPGLARIQDSSHALWVDTIVATDVHVSDLDVNDSGNDRIAKLDFDSAGYSWIAFDTTLDPSQHCEVLCRPY
jgi:hypothetical protein